MGSCQPASICCKTHWLGNSTPSYQFTRCSAEAGLGMVPPPYLAPSLGNAPFLDPLLITHSEFKAERTAAPLVTGMTVSVSWTSASCKWFLPSSCSCCICSYAYLGLCLNINKERVQRVSVQKCRHMAKKRKECGRYKIQRWLNIQNLRNCKDAFNFLFIHEFIQCNGGHGKACNAQTHRTSESVLRIFCL